MTEAAPSLVCDTARMVALTGRQPATVRHICRDVRGPDGYDYHQCQPLLAAHEGEVAAVSASDAERMPGISIPANRIYQWVHVGLIEPIDWHGRSPLYAVDELLRLRRKFDRKAELDL